MIVLSTDFGPGRSVRQVKAVLHEGAPGFAVVDLFAGAPTANPQGRRLVLLHHKFLRRVFLAIGAAQHGHRDRVATSATIRCRRMVATEFGIWRSGRNGGASGSVTVGNGRLREERGGGRS